MDYGYFPLFKKKKEGNDAGELSVFCQSYFNKTLIGQAGSIGGKTRQEVEVMQWEQENSGKQGGSSAIPAQTTEEATCELSHWERYWARVANIDKDNGVT